MIKTFLISNRKLQTSNIELQLKREGWGYKLNFCDQGALSFHLSVNFGQILHRKSIWFWNIIEKIQIFINLHSFLVFVVGKRNLIFLRWSQQKVGIQSFGDQFIDTYRVYISHIRAMGGGGRVKHSCSPELNYIPQFLYCVFNWKLFGLKFISFSWTL